MADAEADAVRAIVAEVDREAAFLIDLTQSLVRIPTVNPKFETDPALNREAELQQHLRGILDDIGMSTESYDVFPGRPNLTGRFAGSEDRSLILCGHVDVVPAGERAQWSVDPFGAEIHNGRIYGRGSMDMKAGVAATLAVARAVHRLGLTLEGALSIHAVVDEEAGGFGAMDLVRRGARAAGLIVTEPTDETVQPAEGGLEWVRVTIPGRNGHSAWRYNEIFPQRVSPDRLTPAVNAIDIAARFLTAVRDLERDWTTRKPAHPLLPPGVNTISPGVMMAGSSLGQNGLPQILTNPAIIPDVAVIDFDIKFLPNETSAQVRREFEAFVLAFSQQDSWLRDHPIRVQWELGGLHFPPLNTPTDHPLVQTLVRHRAERAMATEVKGFVAVCDAAHYAGAGIPGVIHGPIGAGLHGVDEYVDIASLISVARTLAATAVTWCGIK
ncbi:ArgE/DapE family deacylase [Acidisoma cellulosilytica]|uniref:ArgE/DapE family deacylase n=1 Tax=Acidisoma cellulosilyticum TaxID=2802395 RepID=A0A963Z3P4_9PROT|nr:ArgE/DapE family deacylase [Acidisoma cellulosilyticum]MCB8881337.1 ArgE/DapE family deacylase [Acidisoma cellulosilyticum]